MTHQVVEMQNFVAIKNRYYFVFWSLNKHFQLCSMNLCLNFMSYMLWQNKMMSYFSFSLFVSILISFFLLFCKTNEIRWMSSEFFKQNNENFVSKIKQNQFFNFVTNNSLNSNAMYFLIFRLKQSKNHSIKFFESNSIFNVEIWIRELKKK